MTARETREYQRGQVALRALTYKDVAILWRSLNLEKLDDSFPAFASAALVLIATRREASAALARTYLAKLRAGVDGKAPAIPTPTIPTAEVLAALRAKSVISIKVAMTKGVPLDTASKNALVRTMGVVDRHVGDAGRNLILESVKADPAATGWVRRALGTCDFCRLLAGVTNGAGDAFPRHDHCGCQPEPIYSGRRVKQPAQTEWNRLAPGDIARLLSDGTPLGNKVAAKIQQAFTSGKQTVTIEANLTPAQTEALLDDIREVLGKAGDQLGDRTITFHVPANDPKFRSKKGVTGGYVTNGTSTVTLNPRVASGELDDIVTETLMPAFGDVGFRKYTITHELGHVLDGAHTHTRPHVHDHSGRLITERVAQDATQLYKENRKDLSAYGKSNVVESYAEAFAQWVLGGPGSSPVADAYARRYGWK